MTIDVLADHLLPRLPGHLEGARMEGDFAYSGGDSLLIVARAGGVLAELSINTLGEIVVVRLDDRVGTYDRIDLAAPDALDQLDRTLAKLDIHLSQLQERP